MTKIRIQPTNCFTYLTTPTCVSSELFPVTSIFQQTSQIKAQKLEKGQYLYTAEKKNHQLIGRFKIKAIADQFFSLTVSEAKQNGEVKEFAVTDLALPEFLKESEYLSERMRGGDISIEIFPIMSLVAGTVISIASGYFTFFPPQFPGFYVEKLITKGLHERVAYAIISALSFLIAGASASLLCKFFESHRQLGKSRHEMILSKHLTVIAAHFQNKQVDETPVVKIG